MKQYEVWDEMKGRRARVWGLSYVNEFDFTEKKNTLKASILKEPKKNSFKLPENYFARNLSYAAPALPLPHEYS